MKIYILLHLLVLIVFNTHCILQQQVSYKYIFMSKVRYSDIIIKVLPIIFHSFCNPYINLSSLEENEEDRMPIEFYNLV